MTAKLRLVNISTQRPNGQLVGDILKSLEELGGWGSVEIYVQDGKVTQITKRAIKKTSHHLKVPS